MQLSKASLAITVPLPEKTALLRFSQKAKALNPTLVTAAGTDTIFRPVQPMKAPFPILVRLEGRETPLRFMQLAKEKAPTPVTPSPILTDETEEGKTEPKPE